MKNIARVVRALPEDKFEQLSRAVDDVLTNKTINRANRRRLMRNWKKYGKHPEE